MGISKANGGLGFWDFKSFNKALLAKECGQLWYHLDSLASRIMKVKYYANTSILDAKLGNKPFYAWRNNLGLCDLLKEGLHWQVGNGKSTKTWGDKWHNNSSTYSVQSPGVSLALDAMVCDLIDRDT